MNWHRVICDVPYSFRVLSILLQTVLFLSGPFPFFVPMCFFILIRSFSKYGCYSPLHALNKKSLRKATVAIEPSFLLLSCCCSFISLGFLSFSFLQVNTLWVVGIVIVAGRNKKHNKLNKIWYIFKREHHFVSPSSPSFLLLMLSSVYHHHQHHLQFSSQRIFGCRRDDSAWDSMR